MAREPHGIKMQDTLRHRWLGFIPKHGKSSESNGRASGSASQETVSASHVCVPDS